MGSQPKNTPTSTLLVDECFASQDDRFIHRVRSIYNAKYLAGLADRWKKDRRPWARAQIFNYLSLPLDCPGHHPLVKRLFKQAEADEDHELMAAFLVAFDRLIRRKRRMQYQWDAASRQATQIEVLFSPRDQIMAEESRTSIGGGMIIRKNRHLFSYKTRYYLRRRAWRYFRRMGFQQPGNYPQHISAALARYRDEDFAVGENILDCWSLMQIAFHHSPVLVISPARVIPAVGKSLGEMTAAPYFEDLWQKSEAAPVLLNLLAAADARLVRVWTIQLLKRHHTQSLSAMNPEQLLTLLDHADDEVQQFAAGLLQTLSGIDNWPIATWLRLLETRNVTALALITQAMEQRVRPERLDLAQCVAMACARPTPVARLGLTWLAQRNVSSRDDRRALLRLANAQCEALGEDIARFALSILGKPDDYQTDHVAAFFDSLNHGVRAGAWKALTPDTRGYGDPALWSRLLETPYDDVRIRLIEELNKRALGTPGAKPPTIQSDDLSMVWTTVLLGIHRGGRAKLKALRQISTAIAEQPQRADQLIPVLAVAIRSVRIAEARAGLSAILSAVTERPELEPLLARHIPELRLTPTGVSA